MRACLLSLCILAQTIAFAPTITISKQIGNRKLSTKAYSATSLEPPLTLGDGLFKTVTKIGNGPSLRVGDIATVKYNCYVVSSDENDGYEVPRVFAQSPKQKFVIGDGSMIQGWEKSLTTMTVGERSIVRIEDSSTFGYGTNGVPPVIPPDAVLEMDIEVLDTEEQPTMSTAGAAVAMMGGIGGSGELAGLDPSKPRTPESIAAAYQARQSRNSMQQVDEKEGLEGLIEKVRTSYFFGFFEGETGQKAPWFLRPSITFPIAFAIVGAAFYVAFAFGGIRERGGQIQDELDDIVLTWNVVNYAVATALYYTQG